MVYAATLSYYAQMIAQGKMATRPLKAAFEVVGSSGIIGYKPKIAKRFGLPTGLSAGGMNCDLIDAHMAGQSQGDAQRHLQANQQLGMIGSSLEHQVLEQLFATDTNAQGFSAVKAIQLANQQGQKIYTITQENYQEIIPQLQLAPDAIADIQGAARAGLTVTTHQKRISINGYTGEGYIILKERGTGAYLINGGLYGGGIALIALGLFIASLAPITGLIYVVPLLVIASATFSAGVLLLNGEREGCFAIMLWTIGFFMAIAFKDVFKHYFEKGIGEMLYLLGIIKAPFSAKRLARELCKCDIEPECGF